LARITQQRVSIQSVIPELRNGRYPAKRTAGAPVTIAADIVCDSHDRLAAVVKWRQEGSGQWRESPMQLTVNDRWEATFVPEALGRYEYTVAAWVDRFGTWARDLRTKLEAGVMTEIDLQAGAELLQEYVADADSEDAPIIERAQRVVASDDEPHEVRVDAAFSAALAETVRRADPRRWAVEHPLAIPLRVERHRARFSSWYEMFPRSASPEPGCHGTFRDVVDRLPYVASMGFDVLYLPPIHPIGHSHRKGKDGATVAQPDDPGSPWAIGSEDGGHTAIHPDLGTLEDFHALVAAASEHGMEIALDIAFQCSPDHPWVEQHPEWFAHRPDGSIQYAENPPKKYQDIYPLDFETSDATGLWKALRGVFEYWIDQGVRIFRVDNPHTKSVRFWEWCIDALTRDHPDTIYLAEAFTRPKMMYELALRGFTQSYTYFAWRQRKWEIEQYYAEIHGPPVVDYFRSNAWPNTPDILTEQLQLGGRSMYVQRLLLAATLSANYGIYGPPFELMETRARPGAEEYAANEKYEIRHWDLDAPHSLREVIARVNRIRHEHPALQQDATFALHDVDNDQIVAFSKRDPVGGEVVLVVVNLDPNWKQSGWLWLDLEELGVAPDAQFQAHDLFGDARYLWYGPRNFIELDPHVSPGHVFVIRSRHRTEHDFDYFM
jgi:starch synthase (maltosyl-transferring)